MGRHSEPGTGALTPDRGFWVRAGVVGLAAVLVATYLVVRRGGDEVGTADPKASTTSTAPATPTTPTDTSSSASPSPTGTKRAPTLAFRVLRESYVTVRVPGGATLVSKVFRAGQERTFDRPVLQVVNGRPDAVRFTVNGTPRKPGRPDQVETFTVRRR